MYKCEVSFKMIKIFHLEFLVKLIEKHLIVNDLTEGVNLISRVTSSIFTDRAHKLLNGENVYNFQNLHKNKICMYVSIQGPFYPGLATKQIYLRYNTYIYKYKHIHIRIQI